MARLTTLLRRLWPFGDNLLERTAEDVDDSEGTVWDAIPSWQYEGRFAEAGGITRGEQERALADVQSRAAAEDEAPEHRE
jgi:hypothetical protein